MFFNRPQDLYHTCYTLTGVSIAQHSESALNPHVLGDPINELLPTHPLFNVAPSAVAACLRYFDNYNKLYANASNLNGNNRENSTNTTSSEDECEHIENFSKDSSYNMDDSIEDDDEQVISSSTSV